MDVKIYSSIIACVAAISFGQVLFKYAAISFHATKSFVNLSFLAFLASALIIYALAACLWFYVLQFIPLSRAYPFVAICFILVPAASWIIFGEKLDIKYIVGTIFICVGVILAGR